MGNSPKKATKISQNSENRKESNPTFYSTYAIHMHIKEQSRPYCI